jgi:hypothetical protein
MKYIVLMAHFIGWVVLIPVLVYLIVSDAIMLYAFIVWYKNMDLPLERKAQFAMQHGFKNFWNWLAKFVAYTILTAPGSEYGHNAEKFPPFSKHWC